MPSLPSCRHFEAKLSGAYCPSTVPVPSFRTVAGPFRTVATSVTVSYGSDRGGTVMTVMTAFYETCRGREAQHG